MLDAIIEGESDPEKLAQLAHPRIAASPEKLREALRGRTTAHHRFLLRLHLAQIDALDASIASIDEEVGRSLEPFRAAVELLKSIPGVSDLAAQVIVSEIGTDMSRFPTAGHLVSWAGLCPRNDESAGKRRSSRIRHGAPWLKTLLVQCAWAGATRKKDGYLRAQYLRIRSRRGTKKAIVAVAASILTAAFHMLRDGTYWNDLGSDYFDRRDRERAAKRLVRRLSELGYEVEIKQAAA
jgi:transposase